MNRGFAFSLLFGASVMVTLPVHAQLDSREAIQLQNQMAEMRRDLSALRDQINRGGSGSNLGGRPAPVMVPQSGGGDLNTALLGRIGQLEEQVRRLQGQVDEAENARQRDGDALRKSIDDMNFKLGNAPVATAPAKPPTATAAAPPIPSANAVRRTPELALQEGNAALARRDYAAAEAAAKEVLGFPKSPRAYDGQFLLAQAQAGRRDFGAAAVAYDDTYNRSRTGGHAQDALLGLANSLVALNEKRAACATLDKMRAEFATPRADLKDNIANARTKAGCH